MSKTRSISSQVGSDCDLAVFDGDSGSPPSEPVAYDDADDTGVSLHPLVHHLHPVCRPIMFSDGLQHGIAVHG